MSSKRFFMAEFISLYSGSSGNSSVVRCGSRYLIVDMGKGVRTTSAALKALGLAVSDCDGILVTHEHSDHVKGLSTFLKKNPRKSADSQKQRPSGKIWLQGLR